MILSKMKGVQKRLNYIVYTNIQLSIIAVHIFFTPFESLETAIYSQNKSRIKSMWRVHLITFCKIYCQRNYMQFVAKALIILKKNVATFCRCCFEPHNFAACFCRIDLQIAHILCVWSVINFDAFWASWEANLGIR